MKKWKIILFSFLILSLGLIMAFLNPSQSVSADTQNPQYLVVFDYNASALSPHLMDSYRSLTNSTDYVSVNEAPVPNNTPSQQSILNKLKDYYTMSWTINGKDPVDIAKPVTCNTTFIAKWEPKIYNIYYHYIEESRVDSYSIETGRFNYFTPEKDHYIFKNWCSTSIYNSWNIEMYRPAGSVGDIQLYAYWTPIEYRITYHTDAENKYNPVSYNIEDPDISLMAISKEGYTFKGWFLDKECTQSISTINSGSYGNLDLYPLWEAKTYKVTYTLPDGSMKSVNCKYGETAEMPKVEKNIFQIVVTDVSRKNIKGNTEIQVSLHNIWYVYVLGLLVLAGVVVGIVFAIKRRKSKLTNLRYIYHSNTKNKW